MKQTALLLAVTVLGVLTFTAPGSAASAPGSSLTTSPIADNLSIQPGTSATSTLQVMNDGTQAVQITTKVETFSSYGTAGEAKISVPAANDPSTSWVHLAQTSFVAQPGVWISDKLTIDLPKTATLGYYYAILFQPQLKFTPTTPSTNVVTGTNAVLVLVDTHSSGEKRQLSIAKFSVSQQLYEFLPATFTVTVHNDGNIFAPPEASIFISRNDNFTSDLAVLDVNKGAGNVLPYSNRVFQAVWSDGFPVNQTKTVDGQPLFNKGQPVQQLNWNFAKLGSFRFGKYYAKLTLVYNDGTRDIPIVSVVSFWVIPWKLLIGALFVLAILLFGIFSLGRSLYRSARKVKIRRK
jgi:hypothetical protein